jgi:hypothetical protein
VNIKLGVCTHFSCLLTADKVSIIYNLQLPDCMNTLDGDLLLHTDERFSLHSTGNDTIVTVFI